MAEMGVPGSEGKSPSWDLGVNRMDLAVSTQKFPLMSGQNWPREAGLN